MSEFSDLQGGIQQAAAAAEGAKRRIFLASERVRALELSKSGVARGPGRNSDAYQALERQQREAERVIVSERAMLDDALVNRDRLAEAFRRFADPRENLPLLPGTHPILLFPVRLETRFKTLRERDGSTRHQLWVRVFPDDCSIDTFDDVLSASEIARARNYWTALWKAGTAADASVRTHVEDLRRGAWRALMGLFNAGRAYWITTQYRPVNEAEIPARHTLSDRILVIPTDAPPDPAARAALEAYWEAVLRAAGNQAAIDAAFASLTAATGGDAEAAGGLVATYVPQNIGEHQGEVPDDAAVQVAFLVFDGSAGTKISAWSQAARVRTFPERFVLLGYQGNDAPPVVNVLGEAIPSPLVLGPDTRDDIEAVLLEEYGPAFADLPDEEKAARHVEYLSRRSETRWMFDFDEAVAMGLGFRVDLTAAQARQGFTRLLVLGIRMGSDSEAGRRSLEDLLHHHQFGDSGFSLLPQGTPTNNTEDAESGQSEFEDADEAFDRYFAEATPDEPAEPRLQRDGRRLAGLLGIDPEASALRTAEHYSGSDQTEAEAMHIALWNATIGFYLESMVTPVMPPATRELVRTHLVTHVKGRGAIPAIRVGRQPYGILPISDLRNLEWLSATLEVPRQWRALFDFLRGLYTALKTMRADWMSRAGQAAHVGKSGNAHAILLQALGLHAGSVEFDRRIAESFDQIKNALYAQGVLGDDIDNLDQIYKARGLQLLERLGYAHDTQADPEIPILTRSFIGRQQDVDKPLIDDTPLSEERRIRAYTGTGENYIEWLLRNATEDHGRIRRQEGFLDGKPPVAMLYDLLRHALNLEFGNAGIRLHERAGILTAAEAEATRLDAKFIGVRTASEVAESRWDLTYREEPRIAAQGMVVDHIVSLLRDAVADDATSHLAEVLGALEVLKDVPTARLERCLVEHLDCCHYRLDAWLLSLLHVQLEVMRGAGGEGGPGRGIYLGAFGWVEDLKSDDRELTPARLDEVQRETFDPDGTGRIVTDSGNGGQLHAPSTAHALTAAVLRNAYISTASSSDAEQYKVNLSSERVRMALAIIEGMQQGQGLAELLGYRLERGLHDHNEEELDIFIYELRKIFPLASNRLKRTAIKIGRVAGTVLESTRFAEELGEFEDDKAVTKVEARNVVNGLALLEHIRTSGKSSYPFGYDIGTGPGKLRQATDAERDAIDAEIRILMNVRDAVADLALAESVHQVVQGNYDRAAGALDAYSKGSFPQLPDVIQSPASGRTLTHRFGIHLPAGVAPASGLTPRAMAEPAIAAWLRDLLPPPDRIACRLRFRAPALDGEAPGPWTSVRITLQDLALEPIDLLYLHDAGSARDLGPLDDHVLRVFRSSAPRRPDLEIAVDYTAAEGGDVTFFELGASLSELRTLILAARPLEASDIALPNEGSKAQNVSAEVRPERITAARVVFDSVLADLKSDIIDVFEPLIDVEDMSVGLSNLAAIVAAVDARSDIFAGHMAALSLFGLTGAGSGYVHDRKRDIHEAIRSRVLAYRTRWDDFAARYQALIGTDLPAAATEREQIAVLQRAETLISTTFTTTFADVAALRSAVEAKKVLFDARYGELTAFLSSGFLTLADQHAAATNLAAGTDAFDQEPLAIDEEVRLFVVLVEDMLKQAQQLHARGTRSSGAVQDLLTGAAAATPAEKLDAMKQAAVLLFGEGFRLLPEFRLGADRALELQNCRADLNQLLEYQKTTLERDFPVDDWLYGAARVRDKLAAWENLVMLAEALRDRPPMDLTPFQLPYREHDTWLALDYPESHAIESDTLLYTAWAPGFDPSAAIVGLLVDEWTETIPVRQQTTALTFHYDRPNCEAPQSLLLVTPASMTGAWSWAGVVSSLHEALDLARLRAVEPDQLDQLDYARLLPATVATLTYRPVTVALNYAALTAAQVP